MIRLFELATVVIVVVLVLNFLQGMRRGATAGGGADPVAASLQDIAASLRDISASLRQIARCGPG